MKKPNSSTLVSSDYVICAALRRVPDIFNINLLFERNRGPQEGVFLLEALRRYPRIIGQYPRRETRYSHIIVRIPEHDYVRDDRLDDGLCRRALVHELQRRHHARYPVEDTAIRYRVEPDDELLPNEVRFLFGPAIYIPSEGQTPLFRIHTAIDDQNEGSDIGAIYPGQRLTLLSGDRCTSSFSIKAWPFVNGESLLLVLRPAPSVIVEAVAKPANPLTVTEGGVDGFVATDRRGRRLRLHCTPWVADVKAAILPGPTALNSAFSSRQESATVATMRLPRSVPKSDCANAEENERTLNLTSRQRFAKLSVIGIALQRLSAYAMVGVVINHWRLSFDRTGNLTPDTCANVAAWLRIENTDQVFGEVKGGAIPMTFPGVWRPFPELQLQLFSVPPVMEPHYLGWVRLPNPLALQVPLGRQVSFGRGSGVDIAPQLLANPQALNWDSHLARSSMSAEHLGLSRRHLDLQVSHHSWQVRVESESMSVYLLTPSGDLSDVLVPDAYASATANPGELLVVGGYVLELGAV